MRRMNREAIIAIFRAVPVWLWPFVWLQLVVLFGWMNRQQREVLVRVCHRSGRIRVAFVEDGPVAASPWRLARPRVPAWQRVSVAEQAVPWPGVRAVGHPGPSGVFPGSLRALSVHGQPVAGIDTS
tara:strand:+ start:3226 stop:3603 length:378 start_codon:yes stop_codon:yes gene_type:complete